MHVDMVLEYLYATLTDSKTKDLLEITDFVHLI